MIFNGNADYIDKLTCTIGLSKNEALELLKDLEQMKPECVNLVRGEILLSEIFDVIYAEYFAELLSNENRITLLENHINRKDVQRKKLSDSSAGFNKYELMLFPMLNCYKLQAQDEINKAKENRKILLMKYFPYVFEGNEVSIIVHNSFRQYALDNRIYGLMAGLSSFDFILPSSHNIDNQNNDKKPNQEKLKKMYGFIESYIQENFVDVDFTCLKTKKHSKSYSI